MLFGLGRRTAMLVDALPVALQHVRHFRSIGCFRLKPAILLALEGDVAGPEGVAWKAATVRFIVVDAGAIANGNHDRQQQEIPSHVHLFSIGMPVFGRFLYQREYGDASNKRFNGDEEGEYHE